MVIEWNSTDIVFCGWMECVVSYILMVVKEASREMKPASEANVCAYCVKAKLLNN